MYTRPLILVFLMFFTAGKFQSQNLPEGVKKMKDIVIYNDPNFYSAFPSVVKKKNGEFLLAFRRAPNRKIFGENGTNHVDSNSYLVSVTSKDGENWTTAPKLIYAHPFGGSQDPCLITLKDGTILCASYGWAFTRNEVRSNNSYFNATKNTPFLGGYIVRSLDNGKTWSDAIYPPHISPEINLSAFNSEPLPAYNRGAMYEGKDGRIFWSVVATKKNSKGNKTQTNHLLVSKDKGLTWEYSAPIADDDAVVFNEASVYETPKGDIISFLRTANFNDYACISRSSDGGKTFKWESMEFKGHPLQATRMSDNRVLLVYGYRHAPFGIRARILNPECTDFATAPEIILRTDGDNSDIGYPWATLLGKNKYLITYYYNTKENPNRHIAGTIIEITPKK